MMASAIIGLFFLKFWQKARERLFLILAIAFWLLALERWILIYLGTTDEPRTLVYIIRLLAFILIICGIIDKNKRS